MRDAVHPVRRGFAARIVPRRSEATPGPAMAWLAVAAGWAVALAALGPAALSGGPADRAASGLVLAGVLAWWVAVVETVRSDLSDFIIPDRASVATAALGVAVTLGPPLLAGEGGGEAGLAVLRALSTGAVCFALFWLIGTGFRLSGRDALGFGDVKLAGAAGLWLAPGDAAMALEIAALGAILALLARCGRARLSRVSYVDTRNPAQSYEEPTRSCLGGIAWVRPGDPALLSREEKHTRVGRTTDTRLGDIAVPFGAFLAPAAWLVFVLAPLLRGEGPS